MNKNTCEYPGCTEDVTVVGISVIAYERKGMDEPKMYCCEMHAALALLSAVRKNVPDELLLGAVNNELAAIIEEGGHIGTA